MRWAVGRVSPVRCAISVRLSVESSSFQQSNMRKTRWTAWEPRPSFSWLSAVSAFALPEAAICIPLAQLRLPAAHSETSLFHGVTPRTVPAGRLRMRRSGRRRSKGGTNRTTVDSDRRPGHVTRLGAAEIGHGRGHLIRSTEPARVIRGDVSDGTPFDVLPAVPPVEILGHLRQQFLQCCNPDRARAPPRST